MFWQQRARRITRRLTFCRWLWVQLTWLSFKAPPRQTEGIITTEPSCPSLLSAQGWVRWPSCLSEPHSLSFIFFPPSRCTSLLWLNRLSRDPINHHLHRRPVRSPFRMATSSDMYTLLFTHALHAILRPHLPFIPLHLISQHTDAHTLRQPWTLFPRHLIKKEQTTIRASGSQFSFHFSPYLAGQPDLQPPANLVWACLSLLPEWTK